MKEYVLIVPAELAGERLDIAVTRLLPELTRTRVQKLIDAGHVLIDGAGRKANFRVREGQMLAVSVPAPQDSRVLPQEMELEIIYEDGDLLVLNKPKGVVVHPAAGHAENTLVNALLYHCRDLSGIGGEKRPGIVHRLDKDTSGVLVVAKNDRTHLALAKQFKDHSVTREYMALVYGQFAVRRGTIDAPIARHPRERKKMAVVQAGTGRRAVTHFEVLEIYPGYSYVALRLETGRTHQIRVHLASIGHPVVGDTVYGYKKQRLPVSGQLLHARLLGFIHPGLGRYMEFTSEPPVEFQEVLQKLRDQNFPPA
ncbi:MAG: RluA family pseudouridine synthase [Firmicutes bacterium]|jgi:23S rRNA pseudouridine1911/1915/1917 synthase|nr:RluA family pseudouridine synthase [Bacillota bacterium]